VCPGEGSAGSRQQAGRALVRPPWPRSAGARAQGLGCWRHGTDTRIYDVVLRFQGLEGVF
jgi:hypothetical protein